MSDPSNEDRAEVGEGAEDREPAPIMKPTVGMSRAVPLAAGIVATVVASFIGLVAIPDWQVEPIEPVLLDNGEIFPEKLSVSAERGLAVYVDLGCVYCHSQQVRINDFGGDISRGWGSRASMPIDYVHSERPLFGTMRTGPDLRNIGARQPSRTWHHLHLYNPQITSEGSIMPPFPFLYRKLSAEGRLGAPAGALDIPEGFAPPDVYIVPNQRAEDLVDYLLSLKYQADVPPSAMGPTAVEEEQPADEEQPAEEQTAPSDAETAPSPQPDATGTDAQGGGS